MADERGLLLGVDVGTSSVKVCLCKIDGGEPLARHQKDTQADVPSEQGTSGSKQDVPKLVSALNACVSRLPKDLLKQVVRIGVCGQMHGILLWNNEKAWEAIEKDGTVIRYEACRNKMSALYTWQDTRCKKDLLDSIPKPDSHLRCYSGYGCATLLWMARNKPEKFVHYNKACTIQDFIVAMLCNLDSPVMTTQNAASWGYFNTETHEWNYDLLKGIDFPVHFLPDVIKSGGVAGNLHGTWYGIPQGTPVGAALGDLQCSFLATLENPTDAVINISTSAQLGFVVDQIGEKSETIEYLPYFDGKYLAVAASLNGGNSLATFVKMLQQWVMEMGFAVPQSKVFEKLIALGKDDSSVSSLKINPLLLGERHSPEACASVSNIDLSNISLGHIFRSLCEGLIENIHSMMPKEFLTKSNITRILGNGSGLSRNIVLQKSVEKCYNLPLIFTSGGDACKGAAIAMVKN